MQRVIVSLAAGALALGAAAAASAQSNSAQTSSAPAPARQCFSRDQIGNVQPVGDRQLNVQIRNREVYRIDLATPCAGLNNPQRIIDLSPIASGASMCSGADFRLGVLVQGFRMECIIDKVTRLTPAEVAALPKRQRP